jgi:hypothetical protein
MVLASQDLRGALVFCDNGKGTVPAEVVKSIYLATSVTNNENRKAGDLESYPVARFGES